MCSRKVLSKSVNNFVFLKQFGKRVQKSFSWILENFYSNDIDQLLSISVLDPALKIGITLGVFRLSENIPNSKGR